MAVGRVELAENQIFGGILAWIWVGMFVFERKTGVAELVCGVWVK